MTFWIIYIFIIRLISSYTDITCTIPTLNEISKDFTNLENLINEEFPKIFPHIPRNPDFSIWRLFVKIWIHEVLNKHIKELQSFSFEYFQKTRADHFFDALNIENETNNDDIKKLLEYSLYPLLSFSYYVFF